MTLTLFGLRGGIDERLGRQIGVMAPLASDRNRGLGRAKNQVFLALICLIMRNVHVAIMDMYPTRAKNSPA
jgi:hypothetical protein